MPIERSREDGVETLTVSGPRHNALTREDVAELRDALADARDARVVVLRGAGGDFSAGADVNELAGFTPEAAAEYAAAGADLAAAVESHPAPVVAAIDGACLGSGLELALACDARVATERAALGFTETGLGIVPGWGGTPRLSWLVGPETARRLVYFGDRVDGTDAYDLGLVGDVVAHGELAGFVEGFVEDLAARSPLALRFAKEAFAAARPERAGASAAWAALFDTEAAREAMARFRAND
jgi:enoyl-CoA hydratase/carnithine racemase